MINQLNPRYVIMYLWEYWIGSIISGRITWPFGAEETIVMLLICVYLYREAERAEG